METIVGAPIDLPELNLDGWDDTLFPDGLLSPTTAELFAGSDGHISDASSRSFGSESYAGRPCSPPTHSPAGVPCSSRAHAVAALLCQPKLPGMATLLPSGPLPQQQVLLTPGLPVAAGAAPWSDSPCMGGGVISGGGRSRGSGALKREAPQMCDSDSDSRDGSALKRALADCSGMSRAEKNRVAAANSRARQKQALTDLTNRVVELEVRRGCIVNNPQAVRPLIVL